MVENIKDFGSKLNPKSFSDVCDLDHRDISIIE